jgi:glucokinase
MVVLGPGTGLGEAVLTWDDVAGAYTVWPSEGSHADFAPRGDTQRALAAYAEATLGECEVEHLCCGVRAC